jgi:hypothetical protein
MLAHVYVRFPAEGIQQGQEVSYAPRKLTSIIEGRLPASISPGFDAVIPRICAYGPSEDPRSLNLEIWVEESDPSRRAEELERLKANIWTAMTIGEFTPNSTTPPLTRLPGRVLAFASQQADAA